MNDILDKMESQEWDLISDSICCNSDKGEIKRFLENEGEELIRIYKNFDDSISNEELESIKRSFPELSVYSENNICIKDCDEKLTISIITCFYIKKNIDVYYKRLKSKVKNLRKYYKEDLDIEQNEVFKNLVKYRKISIDECEKSIKKSIDRIDDELEDYDDENEAYKEREIPKFGMTTNDSVKCLNDFEGRTLPFIIGIFDQVNEGDNVLEMGSGTGILSMVAMLSGADEVIGVEINPITCILAEIIIDDLYDIGLLPDKKNINIVWGDALQFGYTEYDRYSDINFDCLISENIYTGMFYELQMRMISRAIENNLVESTTRGKLGFTIREANCSVIPSCMSNNINIVDLGKYSNNQNNTSEVLLDIIDKGYDIKKKLSESYPYDFIDYNAEEPRNIMSKVRFPVKKEGKVDAILIYSTVEVSDGNYIMRGDSNFFNNDHIIHLNNSIKVEKGDEILVTLMYNEGKDIDSTILEVRKIKDEVIPDDYDTRADITEIKHKKNKLEFIDENKIRQNIDYKSLGNKVQMKCSFFQGNNKETWRMNLKY